MGKTEHEVPRPFFVLATQNPMEMEGTYPLPEAQLDRFFFKLHVRFPSSDELSEILSLTTSSEPVEMSRVADAKSLLRIGELARDVPIASHVMDYVVRLVLATHPDDSSAPKITRDYVRYGNSPRGGQAMVLAGKIRALMEGRFNVAFEDIREVAHPALRHRVILNFQAEMDGVTTDLLIRELIDRVSCGVAEAAAFSEPPPLSPLTSRAIVWRTRFEMFPSGDPTSTSAGTYPRRPSR